MYYYFENKKETLTLLEIQKTSSFSIQNGHLFD